ncbi:MAG: DUF1810 domain-containing protein [Candidatus Limnocylindria bacterium]
MAFDPERFVEAQDTVYDDVRSELRRGRKSSHWMWFVFPQLAGLGRSATAQRYAIESLDEAREYLAHPVLGERLRECAALVLAAPTTDPVAIFGSVDAMKLRSSMTLFHRAVPSEAVFRAVLDRCFGGIEDQRTEERLGA